MEVTWLYPKFRFNKLTDTRFSQIRETSIKLNTEFSLTDDTQRVTIVLCVLGFGVRIYIDTGEYN